MDVIKVVEKETDKRILAEILHGLDEKSCAILCYLEWHRHADISELRNICGNIDDCDILHRLKEVINKKAQDYWGRPIVSFEESKIDPFSGEKVLFSWWYMDFDDTLLSAGNDLIEVFNEKDNITIIAQLPASVNFAAPVIQFKNGVLRVIFKKNNFEQNNQVTG